MILLVDVGNTAIKFAFENTNHKIVTFLFLSSRNIMSVKNLILCIKKALLKKKKKITDFTILCLSSVRPMWDSIFKQISKSLQYEFFQLKENLPYDNLKIAINNKNNIGADIIAYAYGALKKYQNSKNNFIIVNMGTATVISLILNNEFSGSIIMPGIITAAEGLFSAAQLLQEFEITWEDKIVGTNTKEAINIGTVKGHYYAIQGFLNEWQKKFIKPTIIFSGNNVPYLDQKFSNYIFDPDLIFHGLLFFFQDYNK